MNLTPEDKLLLASAKIHPTPEELDAIDNLILQITDWSECVKRIIEKGLAPLLYIKIPLLTNAIPAEVIKSLRDAYYKTSSRSILLQQAFTECNTVFKAKNIDVIALKGIYLSEWLYQNPALRLMSDIDLLVRVEDGPRCVALLHEIGYKYPTWDIEENAVSMHDMDLNSGTIHYRQLLKDNISIEIHLKLQDESEKYVMPIFEIWNKAQKTIVCKIEVFTLDLYDILIHLLLHLKKHFIVLGHVQFSSFADITNIICEIARAKNKEQRTNTKSQESKVESRELRIKNKEVSLTNLDGFEWDELEQRAAEYKCTEIVYGFIALVNKYFDAPVPQDRIEIYRKHLSKYDEKLFLGYLQSDTSNFVKNKSNIRIHLWNIIHLSNKSAVGYLVRTIFPSKEFYGF